MSRTKLSMKGSAAFAAALILPMSFAVTAPAQAATTYCAVKAIKVTNNFGKVLHRPTIQGPNINDTKLYPQGGGERGIAENGGSVTYDFTDASSEHALPADYAGKEIFINFMYENGTDHVAVKCQGKQRALVYDPANGNTYEYVVTDSGNCNPTPASKANCVTTNAPTK
ncbi:MAG: hypothetical protein GC201_10420 [Alphaproteobacteria bacterium]|nr:hypothetical protein [Alphaproteobacteria bacterium]